MAESIKTDTMTSMMEEEFNVLIGDYSIPHITEISPDSILTKSQYAKVIFHDIADTYLTDADICCRYSLTDGVTPQHGDRIALYRVGWSSVQEYILFEWAPGPPVVEKSELQVLFKASSLPKDVQEFYQLCYVTADNTVCGASVPFQFRHPYENELCAVEEPGGLVVVRSRSALTEEKLRQTVAVNEQLQREKSSLEKNLADLKEEFSRVSTELERVLQTLSKLETEKKVLEKRLDDNLHVERHVERLKQDMLVLDEERNQSLDRLFKAERHIKVLSATVDTLSVDKEHMACLLRNESEIKNENAREIGQFRSQVDSLSHMLEALTQSKELVAQELRVQQATNVKLKEHIDQLELQAREKENKITELEKEKDVLQHLLDKEAEKQVVQELQDQALSRKNIDAKDRKISELEREKDKLLSELVQSASSKEQDLKQRTKLYEDQLKGVTDKVVILKNQLGECKTEIEEKIKDIKETEQMNKCLILQLRDCQKLVVDNENILSQMKQEKQSLETEYKVMIEKHSNAIKENESLTLRFSELENQTALLRLQLSQFSALKDQERDFNALAVKYEDKITHLQIEEDECMTNRNMYVDRILVIIERLNELDTEIEKLQCERQDVASIRDTQEDELAQKAVELAEKEGNTRWYSGSDLNNLKDAINELKLFVESSKMRITEIDERLNEIEQEKAVLMQQKSQAVERKTLWENREAEVKREIAELQEHQQKLQSELKTQLATEQVHTDPKLSPNTVKRDVDHTLAGEVKEMENELQGDRSRLEQDCSSLNSTDVNSCLEQEQDLKLRLQMAAAEYRKLYVEKQKVERRLTKLYQKLGDRKSKTMPVSPQSDMANDQPATAELISLSQTTGNGLETENVATSQATGSITANTCPICSVRFPPGASDLFGQHFESHLS